MFRSINSKFYAIAISLTIFITFGYSLLAYFLHQQNQSAVLAQNAILLERDFSTLNKLFNETRFWELFDHISSGVAVYKVVGDAEDFIFKDLIKEF